MDLFFFFPTRVEQVGLNATGYTQHHPQVDAADGVPAAVDSADDAPAGGGGGTAPPPLEQTRKVGGDRCEGGGVQTEHVMVEAAPFAGLGVFTGGLGVA